MTALIEKNTTIPTKQVPGVLHCRRQPVCVTIHVLQGERKARSDNKSLGQFNWKASVRHRVVMPQIEVTFDIDANGILHVSAKEKGTAKSRRSPSRLLWSV